MGSRSLFKHKRYTHADGSPRENEPGTGTPSTPARPIRRRVRSFAPQQNDSPERYVHPRHKRATKT